MRILVAHYVQLGMYYEFMGYNIIHLMKGPDVALKPDKEAKGNIKTFFQPQTISP